MTDADISYRIEGLKLNSSLGGLNNDTLVAIYIPTAFSPNDDGINDFFKPCGVGLKKDNYFMEIYNRWNDRVFSTNDLNNGWDGKVNGKVISPNSVYTYKIEIQDSLSVKHLILGEVAILK